MQKFFLLFLSFTYCLSAFSQDNRVFYAGGNAGQVFYDVAQIENEKFLVAGTCDNASWLPADVPTTTLTADGIPNAQGTEKTPFILLLNADLSLQHAVLLPAGSAEDIRYLKFTNVPGEATGDLFISGTTRDSRDNDGGYFIGKLNDNFVNGIPTAFAWTRAVWAEGAVQNTQPWDVGADGKVVYAVGQYQAYDWAAVYRLDADGNREVVENWRQHWGSDAGENFEWRNTPASDFAGSGALQYSAIMFKRAGRCSLRSWSQADFETIIPDGNGGSKQGKYPLDAFFAEPCDPASPSQNMPGYTGYSLAETTTFGPTAVTIDRRTNHLYFGFNPKSVLPGGQPDFEPAVVAMDETGALKWWSRLYHEITPEGDIVNSSPDQYIDALAVDYSQPAAAAFLTVNARCHGNNVENLWEGNEIAANPAAWGFQNRFTGNSGNIHISWLGKLKLQSGDLHHATYVAEYAEGADGLGAPHADPLLDGWPDPNAGWPTLNTTRLAKNNLKVTADGSVCIIGKGRRTITTANAYQKMVLPASGELSTWNSFARVYPADLSAPAYSSLVVGDWDTATQAGGDNVNLYGIFKTKDGIIAVGEHQADENGNALGNPIPTANPPAWGTDLPDGQTGVIAYLTAAEISNPADGSPTTSANTVAENPAKYEIFPNPAASSLRIVSPFPTEETTLRICTTEGKCQKTLRFTDRVMQDISDLAAGVWFFNFENGAGRVTERVVVVR